MTGYFVRASHCITAAIATLLLGAAPGLAQQPYPTQRMQILVPFSAGTALDILARVTAERFSEEFKQPVVVVNQLGASGIIAYGEVAAAKDGGHTLTFSGQTQLTIQPNIKTDLPYRVDDIAPVCEMFETPFAFVVSNNAPFKTFAQFAEAARANPKAFRFAHAGPATTPHILGELLGRSAHFQMRPVPYRLLADQIRDVIGGNVEAAILSVGSFSPDSARVLAIFSSKRNKVFPDVPTVSELGHNVPFRSLNGIFAPRSLAANARKQIEDACARAFKSPEFRAAAERLGVNDELVLADDFARQLDDERMRMKTLVEELGLKE